MLPAKQNLLRHSHFFHRTRDVIITLAKQRENNNSVKFTHQLPLVCPLDLGAPAGLYDGSRKPTLAYKEPPPPRVAMALGLSGF